MVKGIARRVVVIRSPHPSFEEAIFIVKEGAPGQSGVTHEELLREAREVAGEVLSRSRGRRRLLSRLPPLLWAAAGALLTGAVWLATALC